MKIRFKKEEIQSFRDIMQEYRNVSDELAVYQQKAEEIQTKVIELEMLLKTIKEKETKLMTELKKTYGEFGLQDVYENLLVDDMMK